MIIFTLIYLLLARALDDKMIRRWDGSPALPYYTPEDLEIDAETFNFKSGKNTLQGAIYSKKGVIYKDLVVFFHGLGAGRNAYMKEISELVKHGHLVYAFDYTGCMESEGKNIISMGQPLKDLEAFFEFLDKNEKAKDLKRYAVGHSWGGYVATYALGVDEFKINKAVSMSGFLRPENEFYDLAPSLRKMKPFIKLYLHNRLKEYGNIDVIKTLEKTKKPYLYIQGLKDGTVKYSSTGKVIQEISNKNKSIKTKFFEGRGHNIHMSDRAEKYVDSLLEQGITKTDGPYNLVMDIDKATEEDHRVMNCLFDFLD